MRLEVFRDVVLLRAELLIPLLRALSARMLAFEIPCLDYLALLLRELRLRTPACSARSSASSAGWRPRSRDTSETQADFRENGLVTEYAERDQVLMLY